MTLVGSACGSPAPSPSPSSSASTRGAIELAAFLESLRPSLTAKLEAQRALTSANDAFVKGDLAIASQGLLLASRKYAQAADLMHRLTPPPGLESFVELADAEAAYAKVLRRMGSFTRERMAGETPTQEQLAETETLAAAYTRAEGHYDLKLAAYEAAYVAAMKHFGLSPPAWMVELDREAGELQGEMP